MPFGFRSGEGYPLDFVPAKKQVTADAYEIFPLEHIGIKGFIVQCKQNKKEGVINNDAKKRI